jgi:hypothetical protein
VTAAVAVAPGAVRGARSLGGGVSAAVAAAAVALLGRLAAGWVV